MVSYVAVVVGWKSGDGWRRREGGRREEKGGIGKEKDVRWKDMWKGGGEYG